MNTLCITWLLALLPLAVLPLAAAAQRTPSSVRQAASMADANMARLRLGSSGNPAPAKPAAAPHPAAPARSYAYVPTTALRQLAVRRAVASAQDTDPANAQAIANYYGGHPYQPFYDAARRGTALPDNDAAAAMTVYLLAGYFIINNDRAGVATPAMAQGVRGQVMPLLATSPNFATPADIAQTSEDMKLQTVLLVVGWQQSLKNGTSEAYRRRTAAYFTNHFNMDFAQMKPGSQGFVHK